MFGYFHLDGWNGEYWTLYLNSIFNNNKKTKKHSPSDSWTIKTERSGNGTACQLHAGWEWHYVSLFHMKKKAWWLFLFTSNVKFTCIMCVWFIKAVLNNIQLICCVVLWCNFDKIHFNLLFKKFYSDFTLW